MRAGKFTQIKTYTVGCVIVQAEIFLEMKFGGFVFYNAFVGFYFVAKLIIFITFRHIKAAMRKECLWHF